MFLLLHCHIDLSNTFVHGSKLKYYFHVALFSADAVLHIEKPQSCAVCLIVNTCKGIKKMLQCFSVMPKSGMQCIWYDYVCHSVAEMSCSGCGPFLGVWSNSRIKMLRVISFTVSGRYYVMPYYHLVSVH